MSRPFDHYTPSRRAILKGLAASAASLCAGPGYSSPMGATPIRGGRFRYAIPGTSRTDSLDPASYIDIGPGIIGWHSRNNLLELTHEEMLKPELAESFEAADGGRKWIFRLRKGIEFHNGKSLLADDVVYSILHHLTPNSASAIKPALEQIAAIRAEGKHTVVIELQAPNAEFPFCLVAYQAQIVPAGTVDFEAAVGTGPYVLRRFEPGVRWTGERNRNYWKEGHGNFDEVDCLAINDGATRVQALRAGEVDAIMNVALSIADRIAQTPGLQVLEIPSGTHVTLAMRTDMAPFDDNNVRLALKYALDREQLVRTVLRGHGSLGNDHPISPISPYYNSDLPQRSYDPERAHFHLRQAGLTELKVELHASDAILGYGTNVAVLYREAARAAGIDIEVVSEPADGYWSNIWRKRPFAQSYFGGRPTPDGIFSLAYTSGAEWNETSWSDDRFDQLLRWARAEMTEAKRKAIYAEMQAILHERGGSAIPFFASTIDAAASHVHTGKVAGNINLDGGRAADRWWFGPAYFQDVGHPTASVTR